MTQHEKRLKQFEADNKGEDDMSGIVLVVAMIGTMGLVSSIF